MQLILMPDGEHSKFASSRISFKASTKILTTLVCPVLRNISADDDGEEDDDDSIELIFDTLLKSKFDPFTFTFHSTSDTLTEQE